VARYKEEAVLYGLLTVNVVTRNQRKIFPKTLVIAMLIKVVLGNIKR
jgi:hypothetical protein